MTPENDNFDKILEQLVASTRSPRGRFSAKNSWKILERRISPASGKIKFLRIAGSVAASILICLASWYTYDYIQSGTIQTISTLAEIRDITLPDQSVVTLNRYSTLSFPSRFRGAKREVRLTGEAYFDVEKDTRHPFIVKAESVNVQVLGTQFNVEAYPEDPEIKTTLIEGSVAVSIPEENRRIVLSPNESAVYNRLQKSLQHEINPKSNNDIVWRNGHFLFDYLPLQEITRQLSHAFNIKIEITDSELRNYHIRANFTNGESLEEMLELLKGAGNFNYTITNNTIIISTKL
jgi:transmembrane sensor